MSNILKFWQLCILIAVVIAINSIKLTANVTVDNSYFINRISELEKENKELKDDSEFMIKFRDERCVCKPYGGSYEDPMTKTQICNTPDDKLYFYGDN